MHRPGNFAWIIVIYPTIMACSSSPEAFAAEDILNWSGPSDARANSSHRNKLKRELFNQCKTINLYIRELGNKDELDLMRKQLVQAFGTVVRLHYDFAENTHLTGWCWWNQSLRRRAGNATRCKRSLPSDQELRSTRDYERLWPRIDNPLPSDWGFGALGFA